MSGKITDKKTNQPIAGANIYFPDLKTGTISKPDGAYRIDNLPQTKISVQVSFIGYKTIIEAVDLSAATQKDFALEEAVTEMHTLVITGTSLTTEKNKTPAPITVVTPTQLLQTSSVNIIDAISHQPGISQLTTGTGISKPIIRGLGSNRVVVVQDGIRQEGQQWGDEHGIEIDQYGVNKVEILKGPASLTYGSDALAGVINMLSAPTLPEGEIKGNILGNYQTNNGLIGYSGNISGNQKGFIWDLRYTGKQAHAYTNRYDGLVYGSGFRENTFSGIIGLNKSYGYSHLHFGNYHLEPGIVEGERDSASGKFVKEFSVNDSIAGYSIVSDAELKSYKVSIPYQDIRHYKISLNNNIVTGNGNLKFILGFQQNHRKEFGNIFYPDKYGLYFLLNTFNYDIHYILPEKNNWRTSFGINGMHQQSQNKGAEFLVPEYSLFDIGGFFITKKSWKKLDGCGGIRYDIRTENGEDLFTDSLGNPVSPSAPNSFHRFTAFNSDFSALSGSIGFAYHFSEEVFAKFNLSKGFRSPNIAELGARGPHEGTLRYEIGNPDMKAETSLQFDFAFGINSEHVSAEADLFYNTITNFIYLKKLYSISGNDSIIDPAQPLPVFRYSQGRAVLFGGEAVIDIHPHPLHWLHLENSFSYLHATQSPATDSTRYLPFMPPAKFSSDIRTDVKKIGKIFSNAYFKLGIEYYFKQNKIYSAFSTETATDNYTLINFGAGATLLSKNKTICSLYISANNLTDVAYQSHLSRLKYAPDNFVTGRKGIYNMGRNISVKIVVPFSVKKIRE